MKNPVIRLSAAIWLGASFVHASETVDLSSLDLTTMRQGYGRPQVGKTITGKPISLGGKIYQNGVGSHSESSYWLSLDGNGERFQSMVGVDDQANGPGSVVFRITDKLMREAADVMISSGMADVGYQYVNIDDCWMNSPNHKDPLRVGPLRDSEGVIVSNKPPACRCGHSWPPRCFSAETWGNSMSSHSTCCATPKSSTSIRTDSGSAPHR